MKILSELLVVIASDWSGLVDQRIVRPADASRVDTPSYSSVPYILADGWSLVSSTPTGKTSRELVFQRLFGAS